MDTCQVADGLCGQLPSFCCSVFKLNKLASLLLIFRGPLRKTKNEKTTLGERHYRSEISARQPSMYRELKCIRNGPCNFFFLQEKVKNKQTENNQNQNPTYYFEQALVVALLRRAAVSSNMEVKGERT